MTKIMIVAGEASGDLHGSHLVREIQHLEPGIEIFGIAGAKMVDNGVEAIYRAEEMSFLGFTEVVRHYPFIRKVFRHMEDLLRARKPDLLITIDYPGFNLRFAKSAKEIGVPVMYYIAPQVWAWGASRLEKIARTVTKMVVVFPFEVPIFRAYSIDTEFVGHPLLDLVKMNCSKEEFRRRNNINPNLRLIGLLPGSRVQEIERLLPIMLQTTDIISGKMGPVEVAVGTAPMLNGDLYDGMINGREDVKVLRDQTYDLMFHSDLLLVASGTATLESAIAATPLIILYKMAPISYLIGRFVVKIPYIGLANVVAGRKIVPEFIQGKAESRRIADASMQILQDSKSYFQITHDLKEIRGKLGESGASARAAKIAVDMVRSVHKEGKSKE